MSSLLALAVAAPLVMGTVAVGWGLERGLGALVDEVALERHRSVGQRASSELRPVIDRPHHINAANAELLRVAGAIPDAALRDVFWRQLLATPTVGYVQVGYAADGGFVGVERLDDGRFNAEVSDAARTGKEVVPLDVHGRAGPRLEWLAGYDARTRPWYRAAIDANRPTWSPIYPFSSDSAPRLGITAVEPLVGPGGEVIAVLGTDLVLSQLGDLLTPQRLGDGVRAALVERSGAMVASSGEPPFAVVDGRPRRLNAAEIADGALATAIGRALARSPVDAPMTWREQDQLLYTAPVRDGRGLDWLLVITAAEAEAAGPLRRTFRFAALAAGALLVGAALVGSTLARWLVRPVRDVATAADALARGAFDHPLPPSGGTAEVQDLVTAFDAMRDHLRATLADADAARRAAEASSAAKSVFFAGVSHEFRTPLNVILGYTELMLEENPTNRDDLERVRRAAAALLVHVNDLLDLARLESGRIELARSAFSVADLVREVVDTLQPLAANNHNQLRVDLAPDVGAIVSDRSRVRQVLTNLVGNAAKFTQRGTITVGARRDGRAIELYVEDDGPGIPEAAQATIFRPFERAGDVSAREGSGLGLAIVATVVRALDGAVTLDSELGRGSRFTVRLIG